MAFPGLAPTDGTVTGLVMEDSEYSGPVVEGTVGHAGHDPFPARRGSGQEAFRA